MSDRKAPLARNPQPTDDRSAFSTAKGKALVDVAVHVRFLDASDAVTCLDPKAQRRLKLDPTAGHRKKQAWNHSSDAGLLEDETWGSADFMTQTVFAFCLVAVAVASIGLAGTAGPVEGNALLLYGAAMPACADALAAGLAMFKQIS